MTVKIDSVIVDVDNENLILQGTEQIPDDQGSFIEPADITIPKEVFLMCLNLCGIDTNAVKHLITMNTKLR